jgi:hypothetical protein
MVAVSRSRPHHLGAEEVSPSKAKTEFSFSFRIHPAHPSQPPVLGAPYFVTKSN